MITPCRRFILAGMAAVILFVSSPVLLAEQEATVSLENSPQLSEFTSTIEGREMEALAVLDHAAASPDQMIYLGAMARHLATSHTGNLLVRPLSSTRDLIFLLATSSAL